ncbi:Hsp70 family protein [Streptomyces sp. M19]
MRARDRTVSDPDNAYAEFKLEMGWPGRTACSPVRARLTPEQLSAEVLKSLRQDAAAADGHQPSAAVITVPASFALHQNNATGSAAALAGLGAGARWCRSRPPRPSRTACATPRTPPTGWSSTWAAAPSTRR